MPTRDELLKQPPLFIVLVLGDLDSGKTDLALSFPGCYVIGFDPTGLKIIELQTKRSMMLGNNLVEADFPQGERLFRETADASERDSVFGCLKHIQALAKAGQIKTLVLDGFNYLAGFRRDAAMTDPKNRLPDGDVNTRAAYGDLKVWLSRFTWGHLFPIAVRSGLNLVVTSHIKRLSEDQIEGALVLNKEKGRKMQAAGRVSQDSDVSPIIDGTFAAEIGGKFGGIIYLEHYLGVKEDAQKQLKQGIVYVAYCSKTKADPGGSFGDDTILPAKNKYGLPRRVDLTDKNFYEILLSRRATQPQEQKGESA